jgi:hypothetical protein
VTHEDQAGTVSQQILDGGQCRLNFPVIGNGSLSDWDIKIHTDQYPLPADIDILDCLFIHLTLPVSASL